ncbi:MAG: LCP family protein [Eubacteriales bacterium]|nr:LCP family protein [Eubacteriales bacterium]
MSENREDWEHRYFRDRKKAKKHKDTRWKQAGTNRDLRSSLIALWIIGGLLIGGALVLFHEFAKIDHVDKTKYITVAKEEQDFELTDEEKELQLEDSLVAEDLVWDMADISLLKDRNITNILLIGQDRRTGEERARSDTMIIASINKKNKSIKLISLMRDMYVPIPGYEDNRINAAYAFGGMELLDKTIEQDFGIHIDGNCEVDFDRFIQAMEVIGNIDIDITAEEAEYMNSGSNWGIKEGINSLTPEQSLTFSRIRAVGNADWGRTERQRRVLKTAYDKVKGSDLINLLSMADQMFPALKTDMTNRQIAGIVYTLSTKKMEITGMYCLPVDGTYTNETIHGMMVLVPSLNDNSNYLQSYIYSG